MSNLIALAHEYPFVLAGILLVTYWIFNAFVAGMPGPTAKSSTRYTWTYNSLHLIAANVDKFAASKGFKFVTEQTTEQTTQTKSVTVQGAGEPNK